MSKPAPPDLFPKQDALDQASELLRALSNKDRLNLLCHIATGELNVGQLEQKTGIHQPSLSQQLTVLRQSDLVSTRRDGKQIYYQVSNQRALTVLQTLHDLYGCA